MVYRANRRAGLRRPATQHAHPDVVAAHVHGLDQPVGAAGGVGNDGSHFVVVSRNNGYEGRDPHVIDEDIRCGAVSDFLGIEIDILGRALLEFQRRGIVSPCGEGNLHLDDVAALDRLSDGLSA